MSINSGSVKTGMSGHRCVETSIGTITSILLIIPVIMLGLYQGKLVKRLSGRIWVIVQASLILFFLISLLCADHFMHVGEGSGNSVLFFNWVSKHRILVCAYIGMVQIGWLVSFILTNAWNQIKDINIPISQRISQRRILEQKIKRRVFAVNCSTITVVFIGCILFSTSLMHVKDVKLAEDINNIKHLEDEAKKKDTEAKGKEEEEVLKYSAPSELKYANPKLESGEKDTKADDKE